LLVLADPVSAETAKTALFCGFGNPIPYLDQEVLLIKADWSGAKRSG
jgi:hypothetical protein